MAYDQLYARGFSDTNDNLAGLFDSIVHVAQGVTQGAQAAQQIASGAYTPYPGSTPVLYQSPYQPPAAAPASTNYTTPILLGAAGLLAVVLVMMRKGR